MTRPGERKDVAKRTRKRARHAKNGLLRLLPDEQNQAMERQLQRAAARLKELYAHKPPHDTRARLEGERYWRRWAMSCPALGGDLSDEE